MTTRDRPGEVGETVPRELVRVIALTGADEDIPALAGTRAPRTAALWTAPTRTMEDGDDDDGLPAVWGPLGLIGDGD